MSDIYHTLQGGCHCGRNHYIVQAPADSSEVARVLFDPEESHRASLASPLPAFLRVPLAWYHSSTAPVFPDETPSMIRRVYEHPSTKRHFCGFCGTPLSVWSEAPRSEADYIWLTLGSLFADDLNRLEEWAPMDSSESDTDGGADALAEEQSSATVATSIPTLLSPTGLPWLDRLVEGSRLGRRLQLQQRRLRQEQEQKRQLHSQQERQYELQQSSPATTAQIHGHGAGTATSLMGEIVQVEWEVVEWTEGDGDAPTDSESGEDDGSGSGRGNGKSDNDRPSPAKRQRQDDPTEDNGQAF